MSELSQRLIQAAHDEHAAALAAIEAGSGRIEEAETLAATLRSFGVADACASGFVSSGKYTNQAGSVQAWVQALFTSADGLIQALADADLQISHINLKDGDCLGHIHMRGLECTLCVATDACLAVAQHRRTEAAHA